MAGDQAILGPFPLRGLASLLDAAQQGIEPRRAWSHPTGVAQRVKLPPLRAGRHMLERMPIRQEPAGVEWDAIEYESVTPWICEFRNALVHSSAGIVVVDGVAVTDTLVHTTGSIYQFENDNDSVRLHVSGDVERLNGRWLGMCAGNHGNYYHWTIDTLGRLSAADADLLTGCPNVLVSPLQTEFHKAGFALTGLSQSHSVREMTTGTTVVIERLLVPWTVTADLFPHPCLSDYFRRLAKAAPAEPGPWPRLLYIDRRAGENRRLRNEDEVIAALERVGFECVRLEAMRLAEQIALFRSVEIIVAPHGAGLANLVYARPGCGLIELHMDSYVNWCFRRLAAVCQVSYDCVIGRQFPATGAGTVHAQQWAISVTHVLGAVEQMIASG